MKTLLQTLKALDAMVKQTGFAENIVKQGT